MDLRHLVHTGLKKSLSRILCFCITNFKSLDGFKNPKNSNVYRDIFKEENPTPYGSHNLCVDLIFYKLLNRKDRPFSF